MSIELLVFDQMPPRRAGGYPSDSKPGTIVYCLRTNVWRIAQIRKWRQKMDLFRKDVSNFEGMIFWDLCLEKDVPEDKRAYALLSK